MELIPWKQLTAERNLQDQIYTNSFLHYVLQHFMSLAEELHRSCWAEAAACFGALCSSRSDKECLNEKYMEPAAFKFDYIATQAGQSSAGMPEKWLPDQEEGGSSILFKEAVLRVV